MVDFEEVPIHLKTETNVTLLTPPQSASFAPSTPLLSSGWCLSTATFKGRKMGAEGFYRGIYILTKLEWKKKKKLGKCSQPF